LTRSTYDTEVGKKDQSFSALQDAVTKEAAANKLKFDTLKKNLANGDEGTRAQAYREIGLNPEVGEYMRSMGFDLNRLADEAQARKLGDVANQSDIAKYNALMGLTDTGSKFAFDKTGASGDYKKINQQFINAGSDARNLNQALQSQLEQTRQQRDEQYNRIERALTGVSHDPEVLSWLGISEDDMRAAIGNTYGTEAARTRPQLVDPMGNSMGGFNPLEFLSRGGNIDVGDIANQQQLGAWSNLMSTLGLNQQLNKANGGNAYNFNKDAFMNQLNAMRATGGGPNGWLPTQMDNIKNTLDDVTVNNTKNAIGKLNPTKW